MGTKEQKRLLEIQRQIANLLQQSNGLEEKVRDAISSLAQPVEKARGVLLLLTELNDMQVTNSNLHNELLLMGKKVSDNLNSMEEIEKINGNQ